jgi:hypothetical protein
MEKIQDLDTYVLTEVNGLRIAPAVDPRSKQIEDSIREILARRILR